MARRAALAALALAVALALAACGGVVASPGAGPAPAEEAPAGEAPPHPAESTEPDGARAAPASAPAPADAPAGPPSPAQPSSTPSAAQADTEAATLWVTRNGAEQLVLEAAIPVGVTVIQALDEVAEIETRYGGRYVQSIEGIEGELATQDDWFFLVNGIEPDVGAAEVKVRAGDVIWWDFRSWIDPAGHPAAAVGAFPEPFRNGWSGQTRPVEVQAPAELATAAGELRELLGRAGEGTPHQLVLELDPDEEGAVLDATMGSRNGSPVTFRLRGSRAAVEAAAARLARDPSVVRFRYEARFDREGTVVG